MIWELVNSVCRLAVMGLSIVCITKYRHMFILPERLGLSFMGGCSFLTIGVIWERQNSPFDGWASALFTIGAALFLAGLLHRKGRHDQINAEAVRRSRAYLEGRGKL